MKTKKTKTKKHLLLITSVIAVLAIVIAAGVFRPADTFAAGPASAVAEPASAPEPASAAEPAFANKSPAQGKKVQIANKTVVKFWKKYKRGSGVKRADKKDHTVPPGVLFRWTRYAGATYTLLISESPSMKNPIKYKTGKKTQHRVYGLKRHQTYYWRVSASFKGNKYKTEVTRFTTADYPRIFKVSNVKNLRDFGGDKTADGKRVRQGMVYRCGHLSKIKSSGKKYMKKTLKVKTELDLRNKTEIREEGNVNPLKVKYVNIHLGAYEKIYTKSKHTKRFIKTMKLFADEKNYPIAVHCVAGKDRTGTVLFMLGGLLGVSKKDLRKGWELSFLSSASGTPSSKTPPSVYEKRFNKLYNHFNKGGDLQGNIEKFLLKNGMTRKELKQIRANLLE